MARTPHYDQYASNGHTVRSGPLESTNDEGFTPHPHRNAAWWVTFAEELLVGGRVLREAVAKQAAEHGLSEAEFSLLWACRNTPSGGSAQKELARHLAVSTAQISGLVERLRQKGMLVGHRPASDRRRQLWQLTSEGRQTQQAVLSGLASWAESLNAAMETGAGATQTPGPQLDDAQPVPTPREDADQLIELLRRIREISRGISDGISGGATGSITKAHPANRRGAA